jgi:pimeloyl-ACP methyl ester carboxylesterase
VLWAIPTAALSLILLVVADTWLGRTFAIGALAAAVLPFVVTLACSTRSKAQIRSAIVLGGLTLAAAVVVLANAPTGKPSGRLTNQFAEGEEGYHRFNLSNLLPEGDQLLLGFTLMPLVDPLMTNAQAAKVKWLTKVLYRELESQPEFRELGSSMQGAYNELFGVRSHAESSYVYVPAMVNLVKPLPVLVFFHGSGANFKAYLWILAKLADELGFVLVAPSSGFGSWRDNQSEERCDAALAAVEHITPVDRERIHVIGLSNGGRAISQIAASRGSKLKSLVFISPVFDVEEIKAPVFSEHCRDRSILVITGTQDDRVPLDYVSANVRRMRQAGASVKLNEISGADHFLMFSHRDELVHLLGAWFRQELN